MLFLGVAPSPTRELSCKRVPLILKEPEKQKHRKPALAVLLVIFPSATDK